MHETEMIPQCRGGSEEGRVQVEPLLVLESTSSAGAHLVSKGSSCYVCLVGNVMGDPC